MLMRRVLLLSLLGASVAQADPMAESQQRYERGMARYQLGEYAQAIEEWTEGFRIKPLAEFLFNIGQAQRLSRQPEAAIASYRVFLRMQPDSPLRPEVERHVAALRAELDAPKPVPAPATSPPAAPTAAPAALAVEAGPPPPKPIYKSTWFWGVLAGAAAVVATGVALGVTYGAPAARTLPPARF
jgi:tetratricopeptide (TPR) repeat protein